MTSTMPFGGDRPDSSPPIPGTSGGGPRLRPAQPSDLVGVEALLGANELPLAGVREALPGFVVAEAAGMIVGVAWLEVHEGHALLRSVAVSAEWRSRGVGRMLVERMIAEAKARGLESIHLITMTADRYFPSFGFTPVARDSVPQRLLEADEFTSLCPASATVMRLICGKTRRDSDG